MLDTHIHTHTPDNSCWSSTHVFKGLCLSWATADFKSHDAPGSTLTGFRIMPSKLTITSSIFLAPEKMLNLIFLLHYRTLGTPAWQPTVIKSDEKVTFKIQTQSKSIFTFQKRHNDEYHQVPVVPLYSYHVVPARENESCIDETSRGTRAALPVHSVVVDKLEPRAVGKDFLCYSVSGVVCMEAGGWQDYGPIIIPERVLYCILNKIFYRVAIISTIFSGP